ncbi:MAG: hypothetical protein NT106_04420 [Candidatus Sumerlaeota bacterium]|nr:hypothetical protein [Candidatus Sumerlaeota bacterium]
MADEQARLRIVIQEKQRYLSELLDYNKRLDRTVVLYISAAYAAIGLRAAGKLDLSAGLKDDHYVWLAFLFIFLNACILLHGLSQSSWCISIAKFIHLKLDCELLGMTGNAVSNERCNKNQLHEVDFLGFDDWRNEIKGMANDTRGVVVPLWAFLVLASSVCSLTFVNVPRFLESYAGPGYIAVVILTLIHGFVFFQGIWLFIFCRHYHDGHVSFSPRKRFVVFCFALALTALFLVSGYYAAIHHL